MNNEFEKILNNCFKTNIEKTNKYKKVISETKYNIENINSRRTSKYKVAFSTCIACILFTSVVGAYVIKNNFLNSTKGVDTAIENGYIYNIENVKYQVNDNVKIGIKDVLMDDYQLNILFDIKYKNIEEKVDSVYLKNLLITDENENILFAELDSKTNEKICKEKNVDNLYNYEKSYIGGGYSVPNEVISDNNIQVSIQIGSSTEKPFPKSEKLNISFTDIILKNNELAQKQINMEKLNSFDMYTKGSVYKAENKWNLQVDLPKIMYDRKEKQYIIANTNFESVNLKKAILSNTKLVVDIDLKAKEFLCDKEDTEDVINKKIHDFYYNNYEKVSMYKSVHIENSLGEKFYLESNNDASGISTTNGKDINFKGFFEITNFDKNNKDLKIIFVRNDEQKLEIKLVEKK